MSAQLINGDSREQLGLLEDDSVDCIITSPPYWHLKRYGQDDREIGHGQDKASYLAAVGEVFEQCARVAKPTATMWLVVDTLREARSGGPGEIIPLPFELARRARDAGWRFQDIIVWQKNKTLPYSGEGKLRNLTEYVLFFTRTAEFKHYPYRCSERHRPATWLAGWPERYHPLGRRPSNLWSIDLPTQGMWDHGERLHFCPFPPELVARCLDLTTDKHDVVLDPFAGVGTVVAQAAAMGREGIGIELNPAFAAAYRERVLPDVQAAWELEQRRRRIAREDQLEEASLILTLRLLKAGKELLRGLRELSTASPGTVCDAVKGLVVDADDELVSLVRVNEGDVERPTARIFLLVDQGADVDDQSIIDAARSFCSTQRMTSLSVDVDLHVMRANEVEEVTIANQWSAPLAEFGLSRHGAFTRALPEPRLVPSLPSLMTTLRLAYALDGSGKSLVDRAAEDGVRRLLMAEINRGGDDPEIAARLGVSQERLIELLESHGLRASATSFAVALPGQLRLPEGVT